MRVALYYPWVYLTSGAERTILELTGRSRHRWTIFTNHYSPGTTFPGFRDRDVVELDRVSVARNVASVGKVCWKLMRQRLTLEDFDALLIVGEGVGDFVALRSSVPVAGLCLTPLRVAFDPVYQARAKENRGAVARFALAAGVSAFRAVDRFAWRRYRHMLTISREAMSRADAGGLAPSGPHELLHPGIGIEHHGEPCEFQPFFLIAGRIMWTKNIELGIRAFQIFASAHPAFRLVIAGIVDAKSEGYLSQLRELADGDPRIEFRIFPTDADLRELYRTCYGLLFTPFNEDWGIVPIEAMTFGKPVIAVDAGGPKEIVVHGESGFLAAPEPEAFAAHMTALAGGAGLARGIGTAARERSRLYSWDRFTARVDDVVESVARGV